MATKKFKVCKICGERMIEQWKYKCPMSGNAWHKQAEEIQLVVNKTKAPR